MTRSVRPVGAGKVAVGGSVGGPLFKQESFSAPVPLVSTFLSYGLTHRTDLDVGVYLPMVRAMGMDVGISHLFLSQQGAWPALMAGARASVWMTAWSSRMRTYQRSVEALNLSPQFLAELFATASWQVHPEWLVWGGLNVLNQVEYASVRPSLYVGTQWRLARRWGVGAELKWLSFLTHQGLLAVNYYGIAGRGAFALHAGVTYYFGL